MGSETTTIIALDLCKFKTVTCVKDADAPHRSRKAAFHAVVVGTAPHSGQRPGVARRS